MTLVVPKSMATERRKTVSDGVHNALVEEFGAHPNGRFHVVTPYDDENAIIDPAFLGVPRGPDFTFIQIVVAEGNAEDRKRALIRKIRANVAAADLKLEDIFIGIVESPKQNWFCLVN